MADEFAKEGYTTLVVDIFNGDPVSTSPPEGFDIFSWISKGTNGDNPHTTKEVDPVIVSAIKTIKGMGVKRVGAVGYCFGAKVCSIKTRFIHTSGD
jgi:dienelactone hydrolase